MEKEFVTYEQVSSLIALGFNEPVIAHRQNGLDICLLKQPKVLLTDLSMILYQQAFRWFRDKHKIQSIIQEYDINNYMYTIDDGINSDISVVGFETYEEAESACIDKLIEIIKNK